MKTIIAGSRDNISYEDVLMAVAAAPWNPSIVVCGMCRGADLLGKRWADENGIEVDPYPAKWKPNGIFDRAAGHKRNAVMAQNAEALIALWDGKSPGTRGMIGLTERAGLKVFVWRLDE